VRGQVIGKVGSVVLIRRAASDPRPTSEGIPTDVIPFGDVEEPPGMISHPPGKEMMNVHGVSDAYLWADELPLSEGLWIRIPRAEGYAVLKTHAWLDRSSSYNYKDGPDLALAVFWYSQDLERLYEDKNL
jgi:predicted nucleotidyltransferase